jgi:hypothetical protein
VRSKSTGIPAVIKSSLAFLWLTATFAISVYLFMNIGAGEEWLVARGVHVNPQFSGGEVRQVVERNGYTMQVHEYVPGRLFVELRNGFVQVDFLRTGDWPEVISEEVDLVGDQRPDIRITIYPARRHASYESLSEQVGGLLHRDYLSTYVKLASQDSDDALYYQDEEINVRARIRRNG